MPENKINVLITSRPDVFYMLPRSRALWRKHSYPLFTYCHFILNPYSAIKKKRKTNGESICKWSISRNLNDSFRNQTYSSQVQLTDSLTHNFSNSSQRIIIQWCTQSEDLMHKSHLCFDTFMLLLNPFCSLKASHSL